MLNKKSNHFCSFCIKVLSVIFNPTAIDLLMDRQHILQRIFVEFTQLFRRIGIFYCYKGDLFVTKW